MSCPLLQIIILLKKILAKNETIKAFKLFSKVFKAFESYIFHVLNTIFSAHNVLN